MSKPLSVRHGCPTLPLVKMTRNIRAASKTQAVAIAPCELDRKAALIRLTRKGLGLESGELKEMMDPAYDLEAIRLEETRVLYGCKSRARR